MANLWTNAWVKKTVSVVLSLVLFSSLVLPAQVVSAAPTVSLPSSGFSTGPLTFADKLQVKSRELGVSVKVHLSGDLGPRAALPPLSSVILRALDPNADDGLTAFGVWEAPNRILLRWTPEQDWLPDQGYSLFRQLPNGRMERLADGLGTSNPTDAQVALTQQQIQKSGKEFVLYPLDAAAGQTNSQPVTLNTANSIKGFVQDVRSQTKVTDTVRQALRNRNLLGADSSDQAVETALKGLNQQRPEMPRNAIISGAGRFNAMAEAAITEAPSMIPTAHEDQVPMLANRLLQSPTSQSSSSQSVTSQVGGPNLVSSVPTTLPNNVHPDALQDPIANLQTNRRSAKTLTNTNFQAALANGLGYIDDQLPSNLKNGDMVKYWIMDTARASSAPMPVNPQITVEYGKGKHITAPSELAGYGIDNAAYLRWQQPSDDFSRAILTGYMLERSTDGQNYRVVNPEGPIVVAYQQDSEGNVYEPANFFTDSKVSDSKEPYYYRVFALDIFGRETDRSEPIDLTVIKKSTPPEPILSKPVLITSEKPSARGILGSVANRDFGLPDWEQLRSKGVITTQQFDALKRVGTVSEDQLSQVVSQRLLTEDQMQQLIGINGKAAATKEDERRSNVESKVDELRSSGQAGVILNFTQSLEPYGFEGLAKPAQLQAASSVNDIHVLEGRPLPQLPGSPPVAPMQRTTPKMKLATYLKEYHIYRSVAVGSQPYSLPPQLVATIPANNSRFTVSSHQTVPGGTVDHYGSEEEPASDVVYLDTDVKPGHYYAYWVTAADSWGNESTLQEDPQIVGYPSKDVPATPQGVTASFTVSEEIERINEEKVAGFGIQAKKAVDLQLRRSPNLPTPPAASRVLNVPQIFKDLYGINVVAASDFAPDGSVVIRWAPDINTRPLGYQVWRAHNPNADLTQEAEKEGLPASTMMAMNWTLLMPPVPEDFDPALAECLDNDIDSASVISANMFTDKITLPTTGCYYYLVRRVYPKPQEEVYSDFVYGGEVTVTWQEDTNSQIAGYRVYRLDPAQQTVGAAPHWVMVAQMVKANQYTEKTEQSRARAYQYKVKAVTVWGVESQESAPCQEVRINSTLPPEVPIILTPITGPNSVMLRWKPVPEASQYVIYRSTVPQLTPDQVAETVAEVTGSASPSSQGAPQISSRISTTKALITQITQLPVDKQAALWERIKGRYGILALAPYHKLGYQEATSIHWTPVGTVQTSPAAIQTFTDESAPYPGTYLYAVEAVNETDQLSSGLSKPVTASPQKAVGPDAPGPITVQSSGNGVVLNWPEYRLTTAQASASGEAPQVSTMFPRGYIVYKASEENGSYHQCSGLLDEPSFADTTLLAGQQFWYRVVIVDEAGLLSAPSRPVSGQRSGSTGPMQKPAGPLSPVLPIKNMGLYSHMGLGTVPLVERLDGSYTIPITPRPPVITLKPAAPINLNAEASGTAVTLTWNGSTGATGYKIYSYKTEEPEAMVGSTTADQTSFQVTGLAPRTTYYFYVVATSRAGDSLPSSVAKATTSIGVMISEQPSNLKASVTSANSVKLTWNGCSGVDGYQVYYYQTEQPEQLAGTVTANITSFEARGLKPDTNYYFYVVGYKGKIKTAVSNVAKARTTANQTATLPSKLTVGQYTLTDVRSLPSARGVQEAGIYGKLQIPGLTPIPVKINVQQLSGDSLTSGNVTLDGLYSGLSGDATVSLTELSLTPLTNAIVSGRISISGVTAPGYGGIPLVDAVLRPEGTVPLTSLAALWVNEYDLTELQNVSVSFVSQEITLASAKLLHSLGQITVDGKPLSLPGQNVSVNFAGQLSGSFRGAGQLALVIPKGIDLRIGTAALTIRQGVVDPSASSVCGTVVLPFVAAERTATVPGPGAQEEAAPDPRDQLDDSWASVVEQTAAFTNVASQANFASISALKTRGSTQGNSQAVSESSALLGQSLAYMLGSVTTRTFSRNSTNPSLFRLNRGASTQQTGFLLMSSQPMGSVTIRDYATIPFDLASWDGQGIQLDQAGPVSPFQVDEQLDKQMLVFSSGGSGQDEGSDTLEMEATSLRLNLPSRPLAESADRVSTGTAEDIGFTIIQGSLYLPASVVELPEGQSSGDARFALPINSDIRYGRNGFGGRIDTEADTGMSVAINLNKTADGQDWVTAHLTSASVDMLENKARATIKGTVAVPQVKKVFTFTGHDDPQGGWLFAIAGEAAGSSQASSVQSSTAQMDVSINGGRLEGQTVFLNGTMNATNYRDGKVELQVSNLSFVDMAVYIGQEPLKTIDDEGKPIAVSCEGLATKPTPAQLREETVEATGVALKPMTDEDGNTFLDEHGDTIWYWSAKAAVALANNLPMNKGCDLQVGADIDTKADKYSINFLYTYEDFMTISAMLFLDLQNDEYAGTGTFWFMTGDKGDKDRQQRGGEVKVRVGKFKDGPKQGDSYWMAKIGYGESGQKWKCEKCGFVYHSTDKPKVCVMTAGEGADAKQCGGAKFKDLNKEQQNDPDVGEAETQQQFQDRGITIGPLSIKSIVGLVGYNMKPPIGENGTFEVPPQFSSMTGSSEGIEDAFFTWPTQADGNVFFIASATMSVIYGGQELFTLDPVRIVVATGPSVEIEAKVFKGGFFLAYAKMGYYHQDRRFFMDTRLGYMTFGPYNVEGLGLMLDISPKKQVINLSYPEILHVILPPSPYPWTFGGGLGFEHEGNSYIFRTKAMFGLDTGEKKLADWFYLRAFVTLTGGLTVGLEFDDQGRIKSIDDIDLILEIWLEICLRAGVIVSGKKYEVIKAGAELYGKLARVDAIWEVTGRCTLYYSVDLIFWDKSGSIEWQITETYAG